MQAERLIVRFAAASAETGKAESSRMERRGTKASQVLRKYLTAQVQQQVRRRESTNSSLY